MKSLERAQRAPTSLRVVVSPGPGRIRLLPPQRFRSGSEWVEAGQPVARLEQGAQDVIIRAPIDGRVSSIMALEGEPVVAGQPVMAIESDGQGSPRDAGAR